jgi:hypothetical protein
MGKQFNFKANQILTRLQADSNLPAPADSFQIEGCNFLNIDVQGFELEVLKGSKKTLRGVNYIYSEVNRAETYENCAQIGDMDEFLLFNGFNRVETIWSGGIWGDALWIRE